MKKIDLHKSYFLLSIIVIAVVSVFVTIANLGLTKEFIGDDAGVGSHYSSTLIRYVYNMWDSHTFPGRSNVLGTLALLQISFIHVLNMIGLSPVHVDRIYYCLCFFLSGLGMLLLSRYVVEVNSSNRFLIFISSLTGAMLYMLNNFLMILMSFPPTTYVFTYVFFPWLFWAYLNNFHAASNPWKKIVFGIITLLLASGNPASTILVFSFLTFYELFFRSDHKILHNKVKFFSSLLFIILITSYIYLPIFGNKGNPYEGNVEKTSNKESIEFNSSTTSISNLLMLRGHHSQSTFVFNRFLQSEGGRIANYLLLVFSLIILLKKRKGKMDLFLISTFLIFIFFSKSTHYPFKDTNLWLYEKVPFFEVFRASYYKFIYISILSMSLLLSISVIESERFISKLRLPTALRYIIFVPIVLILYSAYPFFAGKIARDIHKTSIPSEYHDLKAYLDNKKLDFSMLALPQLTSGQTLSWGNGNYYSGFANADMFMFDRPVWSNSWFLFKPLPENDLNDYLKILNNSNTKYIVLHKDMPETYAFDVGMRGVLGGQTNFNRLNAQLTSSDTYKLRLDRKLYRLFEIYPNKFLPHIYLEKNKDDHAISEHLKESVEYKKISPAKYRVILHKVKNTVRLHFTESFHTNWIPYLAKYNKYPINNNLSDYRIIDGNADDQATKEDLHKYLNLGYISTIGNLRERQISHYVWNGSREEYSYSEKYKIAFISKMFERTIQNENLENGQIFETLFLRPLINNTHHMLVNKYANLWKIDISSTCMNNPLCIRNPDGSYDLEVVLEFKPQRYFYIGLAISIITLIGTVIYAILHSIDKK